MFFVLSWVWEKEKNLSTHEELNLRPSDSVLHSLPLSHRDSVVSEVYYKVHMTCFQHTARISNVNSVKFVNRIIHLPAPSWLVSSIGRALHRYRRGHGFKSRTGLNFFQVLFTTTGFSSVLSCEDLLISSFHRNANMWNFHISKIFRDDKFWVQ